MLLAILQFSSLYLSIQFTSYAVVAYILAQLVYIGNKMASWSDIEPEDSPRTPMSHETETAQKRQPFSLELSAREDEFKLVHLKRCFSRCDRDNDGFIDSKDLRKLCVMLDLPQFASGESANALFRALDVNSQGKIAFLDFLRYKDIYLKSALTAGERSGDTPKQVGSLSPGSETASSYQEAVMSVDSEPELTFESPGETVRLYRSDLRGQQSEPLSEAETGAKGEKRRTRPNSAGLANGSSRKSSRPSSADLKHPGTITYNICQLSIETVLYLLFSTP